MQQMFVICRYMHQPQVLTETVLGTRDPNLQTSTHHSTCKVGIKELCIHNLHLFIVLVSKGKSKCMHAYS